MVTEIFIAAELTRRALFAGAMTGAAAPVMRTDSTPTYVPESEKAQANGVASLDANALIYVNQLPPTLATLVGNGHVYQSQLPPILATLDANGHVYESQLPTDVAKHDELVFNVRDYG